MTDTLPAQQDGKLARTALGFATFAERWFPDAFVFVGIALTITVIAALINGASLMVVAQHFGDGFWSLIVFTMQIALLVVGGYVVAISAPMDALINRLAAIPKTARGAIGFIATISILVSLVNWAMSLIFSALLARACAKRQDIRIDYRAAGAAAYIGLGSTWALGLSSVAAQMQANAASLPKAIFDIAGVIPLTQTIFIWQSLATMAIIFALSVAIALWSAPSDQSTITAEMMGVDLHPRPRPESTVNKPGEWLEHSPLLTLVLVTLGGLWMIHEFSSKPLVELLSSLNTYNFFFIMAGLLLHWRPRHFLDAVSRSVPATGGILMQFPFYGGIAAILTGAADSSGHTLSDMLTQAFVSLSSQASFAPIMGLYSTVLGIFVPSGGGKWLLGAPYVLQTAIELKVHLGWAVQSFNAVATANLINPFFMLPLLGVLGIKARDIVGFTFLQFIWQLPVILLLLWCFTGTLSYAAPG